MFTNKINFEICIVDKQRFCNFILVDSADVTKAVLIELEIK